MFYLFIFCPWQIRRFTNVLKEGQSQRRTSCEELTGQLATLIFPGAWFSLTKHNGQEGKVITALRTIERL